jgi:dinuclear metal center YbgI/SA1388 family protein
MKIVLMGKQFIFANTIHFNFIFVRPKINSNSCTRLEKIQLKKITAFLETIAPLSYQESYDNAGLITGNQQMEIKGALLCLDSTEDIVEEALKKNCNLIIAHHPVIFSGLKKINGKNYVERTIIKAIKNDVAIYAIHTNLDNVSQGVNAKICEMLGLKQTAVLETRKGMLRKLVTFVPADHAEKLRQALFAAGAGNIGNYDSCSFNSTGTGTYRGNASSNPFAGEKEKLHNESETRIETIYEAYREKEVLAALRENHPYEEIAFDCFSLLNDHPQVGAGMTGILPNEMKETDFLSMLKKQMNTGCIRHTRLRDKQVKKIAVAGGAGSFLLPAAIAHGADVLVTADFKYHQFFDADNQIIIADIGHYESEQFTKELIYGFLIEKFPTFAIHLSEINTNPIKYF